MHCTSVGVVLRTQLKIRGYYEFIWERCRDMSGAKALEGIPVYLQSQV